MNDNQNNPNSLKNITNFIVNNAISIKTAMYLTIAGLLVAFIQSCQKETVVINGCAIQPNTVCMNANLDELDLSGVNLLGANLSGSSLVGTNLRKANLKGAILSNVVISGANLDKTNFKKLFIFRSFIDGDKIDNASFEGALLCYVSLNQDIGIHHNSGCEAYDRRFKNPYQTREYYIEDPRQ